MNNPIPRRHQNILIVFKNKMLGLIARNCISNSLRIFLYRLSGVKIGRNVFIGIETFLDDQFPHLISIGDNVVIAFRVTLVVHDMKKVVNPITIKKNSYVNSVQINYK